MCKSMVCLSSKEFCNEEDDSRTSVIRLFGRTIAVSSNEISQSKKKGPKGRSRDSDGERSAERGPKSLKRETGLQRNDPVPQTGAVCGEPESNAEFVTSLKLPWRDSLEKSLSEELATSFNSVMPSCEDMTRSFNLNSRCLLTEEISRSLNFVKHSNEDISSSFSFAKHSNEETSRSSNFAKHANEEISRSWKEQISLPLNFQAFSNEEASRSLSVLRPSTKEHIPESLKLLKNEDTESSADSFPLLHQNEASKSEKSVKGSQKTDKPLPKPGKPVPCPRCDSMETKFCYFNNYNVNQPRHFCRNCRRYWTAGGTIRNIPVGAGRRKSKHFQGAPRTLELHDGNLKSPSNDSSETAKFFAQSLEDSHTVGLFNSLINNQAFKGNNNSSSSASSWIPGIEFKAASHANFVSGGQSIIQKLTRQD